MKKIWSVKKLILIFALTAVAGLISFRNNLEIKLGKFEFKKDLQLKYGLDLAGGSHLVFEADLAKVGAEKRKTAIESLKNVIEKRVNLFGISEPNVQTSNFQDHERVVVELPGVKNTKEAIALIGQTAQLAFAEVPEATGSALRQTNLTGADLTEAKVVFDRNTGKPAVSLTFTQEGGDKFAEITGKNVGKRVAILLDNQLVSAPVVQEKITGGQAQITGNFSLEEAKKMAIQLNAGALPVPVKLVEEKTVGATLGVESIDKSVKAGIVGLLMVSLFMILAYGKLGLVADVGLLIFGILTLALYKLMGVVLTLPGIAGFILSVGMAVDSNILIFERFKEERGQRPIADALEVSFGRAWDSIRDANIATLVTAFVLANPLDWSFLHTSGPVRGFAITLALGIGISLFTGIVVSRNLLRVFVKEKKK
jgi:preprotein translocase subunit SecD